MSNKLTDSQQIILQKYFDGEAGWLASYQARQLIQSNRFAQEFIEELSSISDSLKKQIAMPSKSSAQLWDKISTRLEQEERAAFYLGHNRQSVPEKAPKFVWKNIAYGLGSALTAFVVGIVFNVNFLSQTPAPVQVAGVASQVAPAQTVQLASNKGINNLPSVPGGTFEVDWMKSDGRVQVIPHESGNGGIFWVRRLSPARSNVIPPNQSSLGDRVPNGYNR